MEITDSFRKSKSNFTFAEVNSAFNEGKIDECVQDFLLNPGGNPGMAEYLQGLSKEDGIYWVGPLDFPLVYITRTMGPEPHMIYPESPERWEARVSPIEAKIRTGWTPPVLIVNALPSSVLSIGDGNHRHEALSRAGKKTHGALFWFNNKKDLRSFFRKYNIPAKYFYSGSRLQAVRRDLRKFAYRKYKFLREKLV